LEATATQPPTNQASSRDYPMSTLVTSQVPIDQWCDVIGDPTLADAILDRFVHNAHRLNLTGESMRRANGKRSLDAGQNA
jgi:DNA replication protein DnaC